MRNEKQVDEELRRERRQRGSKSIDTSLGEWERSCRKIVQKCFGEIDTIGEYQRGVDVTQNHAIHDQTVH